MAPPSLFVRPLEPAELEHLGRLRNTRRQSVRQRAQILLASAVYTPVGQIARICRTDEAHVRKVIHVFNAGGFESFNPKVGTGRPRTFEPATRERILAIALADPRSLGEALTRWSLRRLRGYLIRRRSVPSISTETLRTLLNEANVSFQRTRSWKRSTDPQFEAKAASWPWTAGCSRCSAPPGGRAGSSRRSPPGTGRPHHGARRGGGATEADPDGRRFFGG